MRQLPTPTSTSWQRAGRSPDRRSAGARAPCGRLLGGAAAALAWLVADVAAACPDCSLGQVARAQVWSDNFAFNLCAGLAPFVVVVGASIWAERSGRAGSPSEQRKRMSNP